MRKPFYVQMTHVAQDQIKERQMKQILQHLRTGELEVADLPSPRVARGSVLIKTQASLISAGTERMLIEFGQANLWQKARSQPDKVKQVLEKLRSDGVVTTAEAVLRKLDQPLPLGYSNAGIVVEVGEGVTDLQPGDRVASNGNHAELVSVPRLLCAKIPEGVTFDQAAFTTLGSIALQGLRLAKPTFGEQFMVFGVGLLGILTIQLLTAMGCDVLAIDLNEDRLKLAASYGATTVNLADGSDPIAHANTWTQGRGVDGAIITASAQTDEIVHQAAESCRKRGRIILVGVVGLNLRRADFYEKELTFQVSCSYGPGRYDDNYERRGQDYPIGHVRWTEQRNFEAVLQAIQQGRIRLDELITHQFPIANASEAYHTIQNVPTAMGVMLTYPREATPINTQSIVNPSAVATPGQIRVGVIGAGNFAVSTMLPGLAQSDAHLDAIVDRKPFAARHAASKFNVRRALTHDKELFDDPTIHAVFFSTRHDAHARNVRDGLQAGKHVFVEKPLALNEEQLNDVIQAVQTHPDKLVMVGFNRRFSPHVLHMKQHLRGRSQPLCIQLTVNAGHIPADSWVQQASVGGGRIIGEACHFLDLLCYFTDSPIVRVSAMMVGKGPEIREDKMSITCEMADGSIGTVHYFANGSKAFPKETFQIFSDQRVIQMDNYRVTSGYGFKSFPKLRTIRQDKGHKAEFAAFIDAIQSGGTSPIPFSQLVNVTRASFAAVQSANENRHIDIPQGLVTPTVDATDETNDTQPTTPAS